MHLLVDGDDFCYRAAYQAEGYLAAIAHFDNIISELFTHFPEDVTYEAFIGGKRNYRTAIAKTVPYKGNRKDRVPLEYLHSLFKYAIKEYGWEEADNQEADDQEVFEVAHHNRRKFRL